MTSVQPGLGAPDVLALAPHVPRRRILVRRFLRRPLAVVSLAVATAFVLAARFAPALAPYAPEAPDFFSRIVYGARASMQAGVLATLLALVVAVPLGLVSGYYRGWYDPVIMRGTDVLLAFPFLILAVGLAAILGPSLKNATIALGIAAIPGLVRVARGETLALREEDYVRAAVANGASDPVILGRHILPNMTSTLIVQTTLTIPAAIIGESILSFLGLGVQPPTPSWGVMISSAQAFITDEPMLVLWPGIAIFLATLAFNLLGDGLRDVLDPKTAA